MENEELEKILVFIGGILGVIQGIGTIIGWGSYYGVIFRIIFGILSIVLGLMIIVSSGYMKINLNLPVKIPFEKVPLLIVGIVFVVFSSYLGGILIIIAAILMFLEKPSTS